MTFIASVIAREGVAIVADSFVTRPVSSIEGQELNIYLKSKKKPSVTLPEIIKLFKTRPGYTRNHMEKLFQFDDYSAVTTAGHAFINEKSIKEIVGRVSYELRLNGDYAALTVENKLNKFTDILIEEVNNHLINHGKIGQTVFVFSHYNTSLSKPQIFKITIEATTKEEVDAGRVNYVSYRDHSIFPVVTDGQDFHIDRLLFGSLYRLEEYAKFTIATQICAKIKAKKKTREKILEIAKEDLLNEVVSSDFRAMDIRELSLQEAVDFAALLLRIVMDIQVYTEKIPTVGGAVKLATISSGKGFAWVVGDQIVKPNLIA